MNYVMAICESDIRYITKFYIYIHIYIILDPYASNKHLGLLRVQKVFHEYFLPSKLGKNRNA